MRILLTGAAGFVGTHLRRALVGDGHEVVGLARQAQPAETGVTWIAGDLRDVEFLHEAMADCRAVIHLAGIIRESPDATFAGVHVEGTEHVLAAMRRAHITRLLHMSALGAGPRQPTPYLRSKWAAEELVRAAGIDYTIFRPSIIFGHGDGFISILAHQLRRYPVIPVIGTGAYPLAPIAIQAVTVAFLQALSLHGPTLAKTFELCGPETFTYLRLLDLLAEQMRIRKLRVHLPVPLLFCLIRVGAFFRMPLPITEDELKMLLLGSACTDAGAARVFDLPRITLAERLHG